jgi:hypothetical protein
VTGPSEAELLDGLDFETTCSAAFAPGKVCGRPAAYIALGHSCGPHMVGAVFCLDCLRKSRLRSELLEISFLPAPCPVCRRPLRTIADLLCNIERL